MRRPIRLGFFGAVSLLVFVLAGCARPAAAGPVVTVYQSPTCGCCEKWIDHMKENGFEVEVVLRSDLTPFKRGLGVPPAMTSCHTAEVDGYALEGHVPADVVHRLLAERPSVKGIAVPGMPIGSPGMEQGMTYEPFEVYSFDENGPVGVYAIR